MFTKDELSTIVKTAFLDAMTCNENATEEYKNNVLNANKIIQDLIEKHYEDPKLAVAEPLKGMVIVGDYNECDIYVDGSYNAGTEEYGYGVVVCHDDEVIECYYKKFAPSSLSSMRNVIGEIEGARYAIIYAINHALKSCKICYDYQGLEMWATGKWKTNNVASKGYKDLFDKYSEKCEFSFEHIKSHTKHAMNELADALAKKAVGITNEFTSQQKTLLEENKNRTNEVKNTL